MATKLWTFFSGARDEFVVVAMALLILGGQTQAAPFLPNFESATFELGAAIDNTYFPLTDNKLRVFQGEVESGSALTNGRFEFTTLVLRPGYGGECLVLRRRCHPLSL